MTPKPQNQNVRLAILKHKLRTGQLTIKGTKAIRPKDVITKKLFESKPFIYKQ
jgi:hypothetical protein